MTKSTIKSKPAKKAAPQPKSKPEPKHSMRRARAIAEEIVETERSTEAKNSATQPRRPRTGSKAEAVVALLRRPGGAKLAEVCDATGWQAHTARAFISATVAKRFGLPVRSEQVDGVRAYRIEG